MAWLKNKSFLIFSDVLYPQSNLPFDVSPRNILKKSENQLSEMGLNIKGASELEYFHFNKNYSQNINEGILHKMEESGSHNEDYLIQQADKLEYVYENYRIKLKESAVGIETTKGESSIGQHEINIAYDDSMKMCDDILVLKNVKIFHYIFIVVLEIYFESK